MIKSGYLKSQPYFGNKKLELKHLPKYKYMLFQAKLLHSYDFVLIRFQGYSCELLSNLEDFRNNSISHQDIPESRRKYHDLASILKIVNLLYM